MQGSAHAKLTTVPASFDHSSITTAKTPDGRWFDVRIVAADGHRPVPASLTAPSIVPFVTPLYGLYRLACRAQYILRRSTMKWVEVHPWGDPGDDRLPAPDRSRPVLRDVAPDEIAARNHAREVTGAIASGKVAL